MGLKKVLGKGVLMLTGYATVVASGFAIGVGGAAEAAGPVASLSYWAIGGLATLATAFVFSELATMFPKCGGIWEYTKQVFGKDHPVSFMLGWIYWFALLFGLNVELVSVGIYVHVLVPAIPQWVGSVVCSLIFLAVNRVGVKLSALVEAAFGVILIASSALFVVMGATMIDPTNYQPFAPYGTVEPFLQTLPYVVIAFCGFEVVATLTEESKNPTKDIPHALIGAAIFLTVLFGAFATVLYGLFPADGFAELGTDAPLIVVGGSLFGLAGIVWMTIHCFTGSMSTANGGVMGQTRVLYAMAREGWFPRSFSKLDENGTPTTALLVTAVSMILVSFLPIVTPDAWTLAGFLGVFGYGLCYMFACGLLIYLRVKQPDLERPFRCPLVPVIPAVGIVLYALAIAFSGIQVIVVGVVWCAAGVAYYYLVGCRSRAKYLAEQGSETVVSPRNAAAQPAAIVSE